MSLSTQISRFILSDAEKQKNTGVCVNVKGWWQRRLLKLFFFFFAFNCADSLDDLV